MKEGTFSQDTPTGLMNLWHQRQAPPKESSRKVSRVCEDLVAPGWTHIQQRAASAELGNHESPWGGGAGPVYCSLMPPKGKPPAVAPVSSGFPTVFRKQARHRGRNRRSISEAP